uniref:Alpha 1,4-glycosyltransferase domain-containing protein n=1 Tax=viral metagenome TaxID=1070528 RepID=A0A6C0J072_9ZZZZ
MIPKIIHQTWRTDTLPEIFQHIYDKNKELNPEFEFRLWNHKNNESDIDILIKEEFNEIYNIYNNTRFGVQKADIARLAILYKYGGVYFDLDIMAIKPINDLIDYNSNTVYVALEPKEQTLKIFNSDKVLCNAFIATPPKNPLFKIALENIKTAYYINGNNIYNMFNFFGAGLISHTLLNNDINCNYIDSKLIYPINDPKFNDLSCSKKDWNMLKKGDYNNAYMVHYWIHSDFESKKLIEKFKFDKNKNIHDNIYQFFKELYPYNFYLAE